MTYALVLNDGAMVGLRELRRADPVLAASVIAALRALTTNPSPTASRPLGGSAFRRMALGECRVLYELDEIHRAITVHSVGRVAPPAD